MTDFFPGRRRWELDREALAALLGALSDDPDSAGAAYEELRRKIINLLAWEQCVNPEELADEVLNRLARKVLEDTVIPHLDRFAFGIARMVILEEHRKQKNRQRATVELQSRVVASARDWSQLDRMQACLDALPVERRELIQQYYSEDRGGLAHKLGISVNALRNRALRIRAELFDCLSRKRDRS